MKPDSTKSLKWMKGLTIAVSIYSSIYIILLTFRAMYYIGWTNIGPEPVKWIEGHEGLQCTVLSIWWFTGVAFNLLMLMFAINSTRRLKAGTLFPASNVGILFGCAAAHLFYKLASNRTCLSCSKQEDPLRWTLDTTNFSSQPSSASSQLSTRLPE